MQHAITMKRWPPFIRSMAGPIRGDSTANGSIVITRYRSTGPRASPAGTLKNSDPARAAVTMASAMVDAAWVRASLVNGVTMNALAPSAVAGLASPAADVNSLMDAMVRTYPDSQVPPGAPVGQARTGRGTSYL